MEKILKEQEEKSLDLEPIDDMLFGLPFNVYDYSIQTTYKNKSFYIMFWDELHYNNKEISYDEFEEICDEILGDGNWGTSDVWITCDDCYEAIYTDDYYEHDYFISDEGSVQCGNCVRKHPDDYFEFLTNNQDAKNKLIDDRQTFIDNGYEIILEFDYYNKPHTDTDKQNILNDLEQEHPNGEFIFDDNGYNGYYVWGKSSTL